MRPVGRLPIRSFHSAPWLGFQPQTGYSRYLPEIPSGLLGRKSRQAAKLKRVEQGRVKRPFNKERPQEQPCRPWGAWWHSPVCYRRRDGSVVVQLLTKAATRPDSQTLKLPLLAGKPEHASCSAAFAYASANCRQCSRKSKPRCLCSAGQGSGPPASGRAVPAAEGLGRRRSRWSYALPTSPRRSGRRTCRKLGAAPAKICLPWSFSHSWPICMVTCEDRSLLRDETSARATKLLACAKRSAGRVM